MAATKKAATKKSSKKTAKRLKKLGMNKTELIEHIARLAKPVGKPRRASVPKFKPGKGMRDAIN
jgi:hypothetical protein